MRAFAGLAALTLLAACQQQPAATTADGAWVRLPAVSGNPGAAYFTVHGGREAAVLASVETPVAVRSEMHESMSHEGHAGMSGGSMSMQPIRDVAVPAGATLDFAPGGKHVMLYDIKPNTSAGATVPLTLTFADGKTLTAHAIVVGAGDPAPR